MKHSLVHKAEAYAKEVLKGFPRDFHYHDIEHTTNVAQATLRIGRKSNVSRTDLENLQIAAWFHDLGYQEGVADHEEESVRIMKAKLREWDVDESRISEVERLILATKMPHKPTDILTGIMCDADLFHLCQPDFYKSSEKLRKEINCTCCKSIQPAEWVRMNLEFLKNHRYFTEYGRKVLGPLKNKTMLRISRHL